MTLWLWTGFLGLIFSLLALDLGVFNRKLHVIRVREALGWTAFWITLAMIFNGAIYFMYEHHWLGIGVEVGHDLTGKQAALQFFTGFIIEKSLSLDNIFVIALIFSYFRVPGKYQHRVLYWGILGALITRGMMIFAGVALIERFGWMIYVFGGLLLFTAIKMLVEREEKVDPEKNRLVRFAQRFFPVVPIIQNERFFTRLNGRRAMTPLFIVLLVIESTDVLFAIDSIPAIFSITYDPFIIFTSNVFAILGLRSLYFALAAVLERFRYMKVSLVFVLAFVGVKMLLSNVLHIPTLASLAIIAGILMTGVLASLLTTRPSKAAPDNASHAKENRDLEPVDIENTN